VLLTNVSIYANISLNYFVLTTNTTRGAKHTMESASALILLHNLIGLEENVQVKDLAQEVLHATNCEASMRLQQFEFAKNQIIGAARAGGNAYQQTSVAMEIATYINSCR
jgi:hypothetical protein